MNYIVLDLEWNQSPDGKKHSNKKLPFEIIEIGAVKLNENKEILDTFQCLVKPQVYNWIHNSIHDVIHMDYKDLQDGKPFPTAAQEFLTWCGEAFFLFTWGNQDTTEFQRNLKYYDLLQLLPGPVVYYDLQKLFSIFFEDSTSRRSLEYAIDFLQIQKNDDFHRALADAKYTADILQQMDLSQVLSNSSLDVYQNPKKKREEIHMLYPDYYRFISREFPSREKAMKDREVTSTRCPICGHPAKRKIRWFMNNSKVFYSVSNCAQHGSVIGRIRIRKTDEDMYFAIKKLHCADIEEAEEIRLKRDSLRLKRKLKKRVDKEV